MTNFECCKSKTFPNSYYVCTICFKVYHKSCALKDKNNFTFVKDFQLKCCVPDQFDFDRSILEQTVSELEESSIMKDAHIDKLLRKNELFLKEVTQREEELIETIRQQEEPITRAKSEIYSLKKLLEKPRYTTETKSTQTVKNSKIASTQSTIFTREATVQTIDISNVTDYPAETKKKEATKIVEAISKASPDVKISEFNPTPKILILCDELGYGLGKSITKFIGNEFSLETLIKPGAYFVNVIEDIINLSTNFGLNDYIIVLAGSNDFHAEKFPLFREINSKAKCSSHTNIIFSSVPHGNHVELNDFIYKFHLKLNDYSHKLNHYAEGDISFFDLNNVKGSMISRKEIVKKNLNIILRKKQVKNLKFVSVENDITDSFLDPSLKRLEKI
ncbi:hypothetical protein JTB14_030281 [Gonioctena quinquepunctata]|nr:hypothetical protein JTB14_030281 [Gonioctena quinquepunctata]